MKVIFSERIINCGQQEYIEKEGELISIENEYCYIICDGRIVKRYYENVRVNE